MMIRTHLVAAGFALSAVLPLPTTGSPSPDRPKRPTVEGINVEILNGDLVACPGDLIEFVFVTRMIGGAEGVQFRNIFVESSLCPTLTFVGGDTNGNGALDFGEEFTNICSVVLTESVVHTAIDGADVYVDNEKIGTVSGSDTSMITVIDCDPGCTLTPGFWKTHPEAWPVPTITIGGVEYTVDEGIAILAQPIERDATLIVAHHLIAAVLNLAAGADGAAVAEVLAAADAWLTDTPIGSHPIGKVRNTGIKLARILDDYNNGLIGPGACSD